MDFETYFQKIDEIDSGLDELSSVVKVLDEYTQRLGKDLTLFILYPSSEGLVFKL